MMLFWRLLLIILVVVIIAALIFGWYRTHKTQTSANQAKFLAGTLPSPEPSGLYSGSVTGYTGPWKGKKFDSAAKTGINIFDEQGQETEQYPFKTAIGPGLRDDIDVFKIDYNTTGNPVWIRPVLDEIVQTPDGKYLGKLHYRLGPFSVALGYFTLTKP